jgi:hypothetical protein
LITDLPEPFGLSGASPPLRGKSDDDARPPLAIYRVRKVADVEQDDWKVEVLHELSQSWVFSRELVADPEWERYPKSDEHRKGNEPVLFIVREKILAKDTHSHWRRIVLLDYPPTPDTIAHWIKKYLSVVGNDALHHCEHRD